MSQDPRKTRSSQSASSILPSIEELEKREKDTALSIKKLQEEQRAQHQQRVNFRQQCQEKGGPGPSSRHGRSKAFVEPSATADRVSKSWYVPPTSNAVFRPPWTYSDVIAEPSSPRLTSDSVFPLVSRSTEGNTAPWRPPTSRVKSQRTGDITMNTLSGNPAGPSTRTTGDVGTTWPLASETIHELLERLAVQMDNVMDKIVKFESTMDRFMDTQCSPTSAHQEIIVDMNARLLENEKKIRKCIQTAQTPRNPIGDQLEDGLRRMQPGDLAQDDELHFLRCAGGRFCFESNDGSVTVTAPMYSTPLIYNTMTYGALMQALDHAGYNSTDATVVKRRASATTPPQGAAEFQ